MQGKCKDVMTAVTIGIILIGLTGISNVTFVGSTPSVTATNWVTVTFTILMNYHADNTSTYCFKLDYDL